MSECRELFNKQSPCQFNDDTLNNMSEWMSVYEWLFSKLYFFIIKFKIMILLFYFKSNYYFKCIIIKKFIYYHELLSNIIYFSETGREVFGSYGGGRRWNMGMKSTHIPYCADRYICIV